MSRICCPKCCEGYFDDLSHCPRCGPLSADCAAYEARITDMENRLARVLSVLDPGEEQRGDWDHEFQSSEKWQIWNRQRKLHARVKAIAAGRES